MSWCGAAYEEDGPLVGVLDGDHLPARGEGGGTGETVVSGGQLRRIDLIAAICGSVFSSSTNGTIECCPHGCWQTPDLHGGR